MISNNATTGWKLQGASVKNLFIKEWNKTDKNWVYVMLSQIKERKGLFLESKIDENPASYYLDESLLSMIDKINDVACSKVKEEKYLN